MIVLPIFRESTRTARFPSHRQQCDIGTRTSRGRCRQLSKDFSCQIWNCSRSGINRMNIDYPGTSCRGFCGVHLCHQHGQETVKSDNHEKVRCLITRHYGLDLDFFYHPSSMAQRWKAVDEFLEDETNCFLLDLPRVHWANWFRTLCGACCQRNVIFSFSA